jgi:hypothetical protein
VLEQGRYNHLNQTWEDGGLHTVGYSGNELWYSGPFLVFNEGSCDRDWPMFFGVVDPTKLTIHFAPTAPPGMEHPISTNRMVISGSFIRFLKGNFINTEGARVPDIKASFNAVTAGLQWVCPGRALPYSSHGSSMFWMTLMSVELHLDGGTFSLTVHWRGTGTAAGDYHHRFDGKVSYHGRVYSFKPAGHRPFFALKTDDGFTLHIHLVQASGGSGPTRFSMERMP